MRTTKKAIAFFLTVILTAGLLSAYPLAADDTVTIGDFSSHRISGTPTHYTISKNNNGQTVISHTSTTSWDADVLAPVYGYTADKSSEYTRLCFTATFTNISELYIEIPYDGLLHVDLLNCLFLGSGVIPGDLSEIVKRNDDGSYTFSISLNRRRLRQNGISGISFFLDPYSTIRRNRTMTIIDIGFRKADEPDELAKPQYGISLEPTSIVFDEATVGYHAQTAKTVTVSNTKTAATGILNVELSGANAGSFELSTPTINGISPIGSIPIGTNTFTVVPKTGLQAGTHTATVKVSNQNVPAQTLSVSFTVLPSEFEIDVSVGAGGSVTGGGTYVNDTEVELTATPKSGYVFDGWYEKGVKLSEESTIWVTVTRDLTLEARFSLGRYTITVSAGAGGTVEGGDTYDGNDKVKLTAKPNDKYSFDGWYENGKKVSGAGETYTFDAIENRTLEARFKESAPASPPFNAGPDDPDDPDDIEEEEVPLDDAPEPTIPENHSPWAEKELIRALELDIIPLALLEPTIDLRRPISRVEFASVALKAYENLADTIVEPVDYNPFTDTQDMDALKTLDIGIMVGLSQTIFSPHTELTREQAATVLTRVYKRATIDDWSFETDADYPLVYTPPEPFADDADISNWARDGVYFMAASGIINGIGYNIFAPRAVTSVQQAAGYALATREQAILLILRMVEKDWT